MRWFSLLFAFLLMFVAPAWGATTITSGSRPGKDHQTIDSTTDWDPYTFPNWVTWVIVCNNHATANVYWGDPVETGAAVLATDKYTTIPPGTCWGEPITSASTPSAAQRVVNLHSTTASHPVDFAFYEKVP